MVDIQSEVQTQLQNIHRTRNRIGYIPTPLSLLVSLYFQRALLELDTRWWWALSLVMIGTLIRILVGEVLFDKWAKKIPWVRSLNILGFVCLAVGWGLHFADVHYHYGAGSNNLSYTLLVIAAYMTGASTSLLGHKPSFYTFVCGLAIMVVGTFITDIGSDYTFITLNVIVYLFFSISNFKISHKQLCDLLDSQVRSEYEKNRLQRIINTVPGFVGLIDQDHVCYIANHNTLAIYPDIIGRKIGNLDPNSNWEKDVLNFIESDKVADIFEEQTIFNGQPIHAILNVQKLEDGGIIIASIITTELVEAQKIIREQEAKAQYSAKLASLGEMAAGIAHEVNNPLSIIQGSANIVRRLVDQDPIDIVNVKLLTTKMIETSDRISKTVKSLKALSRNAENDPKLSVSLNTILAQSVDVIEQRFKANDVQLKLVPCEEDLKVMAREAELMQVFTNLIGNAIDAIKALPERWVEIKVERDNEFVNMTITDSGKGIPPEIQKKIMEPFFTTKDVNQGTGLGLSISKNIIKNHQGELTLVPESSHTMFKVRLPICHD